MLNIGGRWNPNFFSGQHILLMKSYCLLRSLAIISTTSFWSDMQVSKHKKRKRKGKCQGTPCLASQTEMQRLRNLNGRWLELTCAHMLSIKLLKGFRISLRFAILKSNVYFLFSYWTRKKKRRKRGKKFPKDCIPKTRTSCSRRLMYVYEESQHAVFKACRFIVS